MTRPLLVACLVGIASTVPAAPGLLPVGPPFPVSGAAQFDETPVVAVNQGGDFLVAWRLVDFPSDARAIAARVVSAAGAPQGAEVLVSSADPLARVEYPAVAAAPDGTALVVWQAADPWDESGYYVGIHARRLDPQGQPVGLEFRVEELVAQRQQYPSVAVAPDASALVTWESWVSTYFSSWASARARVVPPNGGPAGPELEVVPWARNEHAYARPVFDPTGALALLLEIDRQGPTDRERIARFYAPGGALLREVELPAGVAAPVASLAPGPSGGFVFAWISTAGHAPSVRLRGLGSDGTWIGPDVEVVIPSLEPFDCRDEYGCELNLARPLVRAPDEVLLAWHVRVVPARRGIPPPTPVYAAIEGRTLAAGEPTPAFVVASGGALQSYLGSPLALDGSPTGNALVVWNDSLEVRAQLLAPPLFADGFESGSVGAWAGSGTERRDR